MTPTQLFYFWSPQKVRAQKCKSPGCSNICQTVVESKTQWDTQTNTSAQNCRNNGLKNKVLHCLQSKINSSSEDRDKTMMMFTCGGMGKLWFLTHVCLQTERSPAGSRQMLDVCGTFPATVTTKQRLKDPHSLKWNFKPHTLTVGYQMVNKLLCGLICLKLWLMTSVLHQSRTSPHVTGRDYYSTMIHQCPSLSNCAFVGTPAVSHLAPASIFAQMVAEGKEGSVPLQRNFIVVLNLIHGY